MGGFNRREFFEQTGTRRAHGSVPARPVTTNFKIHEGRKKYEQY